MSQEDFYGLFKNWEDKKLPESMQDLKHQLNSNQNPAKPEEIQERLHLEQLDLLGKLEPIQKHQIYHQGYDAMADQRELHRMALLSQEGLIQEALHGMLQKKKDIESAAEASGDASEVERASEQIGRLNAEYEKFVESAEYAALQADLDAAREGFQEAYGESVYDLKVKPKDNDSFSARRNMANMEDTMVRRIEAHLLGLEVPSLDFGIDQEFRDMKHRERNQVFDHENYVKAQDEAKLSSMSKYGR